MRTAAGNEERGLQGKYELIGHHVVGKERHEVVNGTNKICAAQQEHGQHRSSKMPVTPNENLERERRRVQERRKKERGKRRWGTKGEVRRNTEDSDIL